MSTVPSAPEIEGQISVPIPSSTNSEGTPPLTKPHPCIQPLPTDIPTSDITPHSINLCGIECVYNSKKETCCRWCYQCVNWKVIFRLCFYQLVWIGVASGAIYLIATTQIPIRECRTFSTYQRHDCLNQHNDDVLKYAFGFCLLLFAVVKSFLIYEQPNDKKYECVNGFCNEHLQERFCAWTLVLFTLVDLFVFIYCVQFMENCGGDDGRGNEVCALYKENQLAGQLTGTILSGILFVSLFVLLVGLKTSWPSTEDVEKECEARLAREKERERHLH